MFIPSAVFSKGLRAAKSDYQRYKSDTPVRKAQKNERARLRAQAEITRLCSVEELNREQMALEKELKSRHFSLTLEERTNALGFYVHNGATLSEAYRSYRALIAVGDRMPAAVSICQPYGRKLRRQLGELTPCDKLHFERGRLKNLRIFSFVIFFCGFVMFASGVHSLLIDDILDSNSLEIMAFATVLLLLGSLMLRSVNKGLADLNSRDQNGLAKT